MYFYLFRTENRKRKAQAIFLNSFTVYSSYIQWKFVVCSFAGEEKNGSYQIANGLDGLNGLAHLLYDWE
jgi:hypothetical protein